MKKISRRNIIIFSVVGLVILLLAAGLIVYLSVYKSSKKFDSREKLFLNSQVALYNTACAVDYKVEDISNNYQIAVSDVNNYVKTLEELMMSYDFNYLVLESTEYQKTLTLTYYGINNIKIRYDVCYDVTDSGIVGIIKRENMPTYEFESMYDNDVYESKLIVSNDLIYKSVSKSKDDFTISKNNQVLCKINIDQTTTIETNRSTYECVVSSSKLHVNVKYHDFETVMNIAVDQLNDKYVYSFKGMKENITVSR